MKEQQILQRLESKLGIHSLNKMQYEVLKKTSSHKGDIVLLSATGTGKTIAYTIPILKALRPSNGRLQALIIAPSRELVIQIEQVVRNISEGYKILSCYGGHNVFDEKKSLAVTPDIIISTPGRLLDHINRNHIDVYSTSLLVLDEFDKSLELGFQDEMSKILRQMPNLSLQILTSATQIDEFPHFLKLRNVLTIDRLQHHNSPRERMDIQKVVSEQKDKLDTLWAVLCSMPAESRCIVFLNYRDAVSRVYEFLLQKGVPVGYYNGALEQIEREKSVEMFSNGSFSVLVSTDLGARGLDIQNVNYIIHYHLPITKETFTHRNGRAARVDKNGTVYVIVSRDEKVPEYIDFDGVKDLCEGDCCSLQAQYDTLYFQAGKKEKISKGDVVGFLLNKGGLQNGEIGIINSHDHYTLVAVPRSKSKGVLQAVAKEKIKNHKVRISLCRQNQIK